MINMPGGPEMMVIILVALVVLGPQQLPKAMRTIGSVMAEIRKVSSGFQNEMRSAMDSMTGDESTSKPQSGSMASAKGSMSKDATAPIKAQGAEVVARNDASNSGPPAAAEPAPPPAEVNRNTGAATGIDPADRAAG